MYKNPFAKNTGFCGIYCLGNFLPQVGAHVWKESKKSQTYSSTLVTGFRFSPTWLWFQRSRAWHCLLVFSCWINTDSGLVQTPLHKCAEHNWWIKYGKRGVSESIWYGSFSLARQNQYFVGHTLLNWVSSCLISLSSHHVQPQVKFRWEGANLYADIIPLTTAICSSDNIFTSSISNLNNTVTSVITV